MLRRPVSAARPTRRLSVEPLEDRRMLAAFVVTTPVDELDSDLSNLSDLSLREAVFLAETQAGADVITFAPSLAGQTLTLSLDGESAAAPQLRSALRITTDVTITGPASGPGVTLAGGGAASDLRAFHVTPTGRLTLKNLTVRDFRHVGRDGDGAGYGGAIWNDGQLTIRNSTFAANTVQAAAALDSFGVKTDYLNVALQPYNFAQPLEFYLSRLPLTDPDPAEAPYKLLITATEGSFDIIEHDIDAELSPGYTMLVGEGMILLSGGTAADVRHTLDFIYWVAPEDDDTNSPAANFTFDGYLDEQLISHDSMRLLYTVGDADVRNAAALGGAIYNSGAMSVTGSTFVGNAALGGVDTDSATDFIVKTGTLEYSFGVAPALYLGSFPMNDPVLRYFRVDLTSSAGAFDWRRGEPGEDESPYFLVSTDAAHATVQGTLAEILELLPQIYWVAPDGADTDFPAALVIIKTYAEAETTPATDVRLQLLYADEPLPPLVGTRAPEVAGGAIVNSRGSLYAVNSTFSGNSAASLNSGLGGAVFNANSYAYMHRTTMAGNIAALTGGAVYNLAEAGRRSDVEFGNSILGDSLDRAQIVNHQLPGAIEAQLYFAGYNYSTTEILELGGNVNGGFFLPTPASLALGPLASNGGRTQTHALLPGSSAINAGDPWEVAGDYLFDQRGAGYSRVSGGRIDVGAYEVAFAPDADFNGSGYVDGDDFLIWQQRLGSTDDYATHFFGNADGDNDVDADDLAIWSAGFGGSVALAASTPDLAAAVVAEESDSMPMSQAFDAAMAALYLQETASPRRPARPRWRPPST